MAGAAPVAVKCRARRYTNAVTSEAPSPAASPYLVLARKYRPQRFEDLIGQASMVRTIANSFVMNRIPHAYILTGVRGVGKTTTARLLARALNYRTPAHDAPSVSLEPLGEHCPAIMESRHPDVSEMDAASRTGIGDIRELLDAVRYSPIAARFKIYIIDEVHMLSTQAFNGLLKTLEEPPPHVKFVFATTEIRKIPVTVLSRCQRFDLKRIPSEQLRAHLEAICAKEGVQVQADGLAMLARAGDGSVRDALSLLDQALVQRTGEVVTAEAVRDMLGLADRGRLLLLFRAMIAGDAAATVHELRDQYAEGADPALILKDLLETAHEAAMVQTLGEDAHPLGGADWAAGVRAIAEALSVGQLARLWTLLLKAWEDCGRAPDPMAAAEMALVRMCAALRLPPPEEASRMLREHRGGGENAAASAPPAENAGPRMERLEDLVALLARERPDIELEIAIERHVQLAAIAWGRLAYAPTPDAPPDLPSRLARALEEATGERWRIEAKPGSGAETIAARRAREAAERLEDLKRHPFVAQALRLFPGAALRAAEEPTPIDSPSEGAEIVSLPRRAAQGD